MATYAVQGNGAPTGSVVAMAATGCVVYTLTSAADPTELTGAGDYLVVSSDTAGWLHVSSSSSTKAASTRTHRVMANLPVTLGGVRKGLYVSFLADS